MIEIEINNVLSKLKGHVPPEVSRQVQEACSYSIQGAEFSVYGSRIYCPHCRKQTKEATTEEMFSGTYPSDGNIYRKCYLHGWVIPISLWDGKTYLYDGRAQSFPTGLISRVVEIIKAAGLQYVFKDVRIAPFTHEIAWHGYEPRAYQKKAVREMLKRSRGIIQVATGGGKCFRNGTPILMYDGTLKNVEDIRPGDLVMGIDSKCRTVKEVHTGEDLLYTVQHTGGISYDVTGEHILTGMITGRKGYGRGYATPDGKVYKAGDIVDISVKDWFRATKTFRHVFKGFSVAVSSFGRKEEVLPIDPYILGLWLGDGTASSMAITTMEPEVADAWYSLENENTHIGRIELAGKAKTYLLTKKPGRHNNYVQSLHDLGVYKNKHIPSQYKYASIDVRRKVLAGILDADGYKNKAGIEIAQKSKQLADDIAFIARSVGLCVNTSIKVAKCQTGASGTYYRMFISGNFENIPLRVPRRIPDKRTTYNNERRLFGITVTPCGVGKFTGFSVAEDDKHFLLGNFTVVHNSLILSNLVSKTCVNTLILAHTTSVFNQLYNEFTKNLKIPIGRFGAGIADIKKITIAMPQSLIETVEVPKKRLVKGVWRTVKSKKQQVREKARELLMNVEFLGIDEAHRTSCSTVQLVANSCVNAFYRFGVSATPWRDDLADILIEAQTGRTIFKYSATQAIEEGYLARPHIHMVNFRQDKQPKYITKIVLNKKTKVQEAKQVKMEYADLYDKCVINNPNRNRLIEQLVRERYALGESILVIVKRLQHGENLHKLLKDLDEHVRYVNGEDDPAYLQQTLNDLDEKKIRVCIATGIFSEGVDIRRLNTVINTTAMDSSVNAMQVVGRALRKVPGKEEVHIYDIADYNCRWLGEHSRNRLNIYKTEPGYDIIQEGDKL